jgi:hypothetical protein
MIGTYGGGRGINPLWPFFFKGGKMHFSKVGKAAVKKEENGIIHYSNGHAPLKRQDNSPL